MHYRYSGRWFHLVVLALALHGTAEAGAADEAQTAFSKFFPAFVSRNQAQVAAMFAADAQFYGTLSPELVTNPEGVLKYFTVALDRSDVITEAKPLQLTATALTADIVLIAGTWTVARTQDGKTTLAGPYRMTAVLQKRNDHWVVVQFHNSPRPAPPPPTPAASR